MIKHNTGYKLLSLLIAILLWAYVSQYMDPGRKSPRAPVSKVLFISPITTGKPPYPHKVLDIEVTPQSVTLTGRPARLMEISTVSTEPVELDEQTQTFTKRVQLVAPPETSLTNGGSAMVTVRIGRTEDAEE